jgi:hypothetical protein
MVDLALGGGWPIDQTPDPSKLYVDYIRVYAPPGGTSSNQAADSRDSAQGSNPEKRQEKGNHP